MNIFLARRRCWVLWLWTRHLPWPTQCRLTFFPLTFLSLSRSFSLGLFLLTQVQHCSLGHLKFLQLFLLTVLNLHISFSWQLLLTSFLLTSVSREASFPWCLFVMASLSVDTSFFEPLSLDISFSENIFLLEFLDHPLSCHLFFLRSLSAKMSCSWHLFAWTTLFLNIHLFALTSQTHTHTHVWLWHPGRAIWLLWAINGLRNRIAAARKYTS